MSLQESYTDENPSEVSEYEDDEYDDDDYYNNDDDILSDDDTDSRNKGDVSDNNNVKKMLHDLEYFDFTCIPIENIDEKFEHDCSTLATKLKISPSTADMILQSYKWQIPFILQNSNSPKDIAKILTTAGAENMSLVSRSNNTAPSVEDCGVCFDILPQNKLFKLSCAHGFCRDCWKSHIEYTVNDGMPNGIKCMAKGCSLRCPNNFIEQFLTTKSDLLKNFLKLLRNSRISAHYQLRFCVGADCQMVMFAEVPKARLVECNKCHSSFCFECGNSYHSPTDCETIAKWLTKSRDDSETANYICANTKSCPKCHICIEKNGGCNHITCWKCKHDFCWMCLQDWKSHGSSYYACSRYQEDPLIAEQSHEDRAREALKKYLFYFERWENHHRSLLLEEEARKKILKQIEDKVMHNDGTWIDWQYLLRAGELLAKCRLTLQNTYPLAYYSPPGAEKELFEYQQAQLEAVIEELSWKLEHAGSYQRGEIENQMDIAGKRRHTLLTHFLRD